MRFSNILGPISIPRQQRFPQDKQNPNPKKSRRTRRTSPFANANFPIQYQYPTSSALLVQGAVSLARMDGRMLEYVWMIVSSSRYACN
jgi:hypothetical protein